jgi:hypothetical protein
LYDIWITTLLRWWCEVKETRFIRIHNSDWGNEHIIYAFAVLYFWDLLNCYLAEAWHVWGRLFGGRGQCHWCTGWSLVSLNIFVSFRQILLHNLLMNVTVPNSLEFLLRISWESIIQFALAMKTYNWIVEICTGRNRSRFGLCDYLYILYSWPSKCPSKCSFLGILNHWK